MVLSSLLSEIYFEKVEGPSSLFSAERLKELAPLYVTLNLQYQLLASSLDELLKAKLSLDTYAQICLQMQAAYRLGEVLSILYQDYLNDPREVARVQKQQQTYALLLNEVSLNKTLNEASFARKVRANTAEVNLYRLLFVRSKRAVDIISHFKLLPATQDAYLKSFNYYANPLLIILSWLYFAPRLAVNFFLLVKHTVDGSWIGGAWMSKNARDLGLLTRFIMQLQQCWFELGNDLVWFSAGCLAHLAWMGVLAPVSVYLTLAFFVYDLVASGIRTYLELDRVLALKKANQALEKQGEDAEWMQTLLAKALNKQMVHDLLRLGMHFGVSAAIVVCIACALPAFVANPVIPVAGAVALALLCVVNFLVARINNASRPTESVNASALKHWSIFKEPRPSTSDTVDLTVPSL